VIDSGLFVGTLRHRRFTPVPHAFTYPLFMVLLDVDRVPELMNRSRLTSHNRWNWASFADRDHLGNPGRPLRERLVVDAARRGIEVPTGPIFLLTHLRYLGYCFNPVSFFYCFDRAEQLRAVHLGNEFFRLFLDADLLMYSCGYFESAADALEQAQAQKVDRICRALRLAPGDHVLEIGSGWGGFAVWAATRYGCRMTTTTISDEQYRHICEWRSRIGEAGARIEVLRADYRRTDRAVRQGRQHRDVRGGRPQPLRRVFQGRRPPARAGWRDVPADHHGRRSVVPEVPRTPDWIEKYIFPGGELASVGETLRSLARTTSLSLYHAENCGTHYAHTLRSWRARFHHNLARVRALGFDDRFIRMWDLYLGSCEATFLERHTGLFQLVLRKNGGQRVLFNEPWAEAASRAHAAGASESAA
jgi:cyclopropane fatty-acyl-phospholipid synthase-like methyltransferase